MYQGKREKKRELLEETDEKDVRDIKRFEEVKIKRDVGKDEKVSEMDRRRWTMKREREKVR